MINAIRKFLNIFGSVGVKVLREDGWFFVLLTVLNLPIFFQEFFYFQRILPFMEVFPKGLTNFCQGAFLILLACVAMNLLLAKPRWGKRIKTFLQTTLITLFTISLVTDIFLLKKFNNVLHVNMVQIVMETNPLTVKQFLSDYVLTLPVIGGTIFLVTIVVAAVKGLQKFFRTRSEERLKRFSYDLLIIFMPLILFQCSLLVYIISNAIINSATSAFQHTMLGRNIFMCNAALESIGSEPKILEEMNKQLESEKILVDKSSVPYVVFILGESTTRNNMSLYGYKLPTTPLLEQRYGRGEIFKFTDTIACGNYTLVALEKIFTFAEKDDIDAWYLHANIFDILHNTNYHTFWLSNQSPLGLWGCLNKIYAERCDEDFFVEPKEEVSFKRKVDATLLPALDDFLLRAHEKNFIVIHLYGTHTTYRERYPEEFAKFTANDEDKPTEEGKKLTAEYDNAVLYNDFIVNEIIRRFEDKNAVIIYISDHGEEVFENGREFSGHSMEENGNRSMIEIPAIIWASQKFRQTYPEKVAAIAAAVDKPYRTDFYIHALLDLMDIRTTSFDQQKSIFSADYFSSHPRIYNGEPYVKDTSN